MQPFEYVIQLVTIVIGLAFADLALSLHRLLTAGRRVRWHWHSPAAALVLVLVTLDIWWGLRPLGDTGLRWTIGMFLPLLAGLLLLFLLAASVFPDEVPEAGVELADHYQQRRRYFWSLFAAMVLVFGAQTSWLAGGAGLGGDAAAMVIAFADNVVIALLAMSLVLVRRPLWHSIALVLLLGLLLVSHLTRPLL